MTHEDQKHPLGIVADGERAQGRTRLGSGLAVAAVLHAALFAAGVWAAPTIWRLPTSAGQRQVVSLTARMTLPAPVRPFDDLPAVELPPLDTAIDVFPDHVRVGRERYEFESTNVELPPPQIAEVGATAPSATLPRSAPQAETPRPLAPVPPASRRPPAPLTSLAADRVQTIGHDEILPPEGYRSPPEYPAEAARRGVTGTVWLRLVIAADGIVSEVKVDTTSGHDILDAAAVNSARQWRFRPARRNGKPVEYVVRQRVNFYRRGE